MENERIVVVVGFLGAGKTTLLRALTAKALESDWAPFILLNDYENASLDAQYFTSELPPKSVSALTGSCICCSGISELRAIVNRIPARDKGITLIEANGTTDACELMEFLGVGIDARFSPPVQVSVVNVAQWQARGEHNALEANQVQVASLVVLTHVEQVSVERRQMVIEAVAKLNPFASVIDKADLDVSTLLGLQMPDENKVATGAEKFDHQKAHWSSCSVDLPDLPDEACITGICDAIPDSVLRVKGCTKVGGGAGYTYFERTPDGNVFVRPYNGVPVTGAKLLVVGPGSDSDMLAKVVRGALA